LTLALKKMFSRFIDRPEKWFFVETFFGAENGWKKRSFRTERDSDRLLYWLNRIDSKRIHKKVSAL